MWWGGAPLRQLQTMFQSLAEDALPSPCPLDGFLGSQEAVRCVGRLHALGSGPAVLEHGGVGTCAGEGAEAGETWPDLQKGVDWHLGPQEARSGQDLNDKGCHPEADLLQELWVLTG